MQNYLTILQLVFAGLTVLVILLQQRGSSLGSAFGGESTVYRSRRGAEKWLFYISIITSLAFFSVTLAILAI